MVMLIVSHSSDDGVDRARRRAQERSCFGDREEHGPRDILAIDRAAIKRCLASDSPIMLRSMTRRLLHYEILAEIGRGGMGVVYKARDTHLNRAVAIKVLPPDKIADLGRKQRFIQEAKAPSSLNHPNIVTIHDINSDSGTDFIVMEYVEGRTLGELLPPKGLRPTAALKYALQIADALAKAHGASILHRDLKPSNIMVTDEGRIKLLDFGLAKLLDRPDTAGVATTFTAAPCTEEGIVLGTVAYMSPEQAEGRKLDARSDIFSFGSVLYELVTGQRPFQGESQLSTLSKILNEDPTPPTRIAAGVPPELERIVLRCLRKDPSRRYQTMADLKVVLEDVHERSGSDTQAPLPRRRWALAALLPVLFIVGFVAWQAWRASPAPGPPRTVALTTLPGAELYVVVTRRQSRGIHVDGTETRQPRRVRAPDRRRGVSLAADHRPEERLQPGLVARRPLDRFPSRGANATSFWASRKERTVAGPATGRTGAQPDRDPGSYRRHSRIHCVVS
jgi:serine/threonine protein kinase